MTLSATYLSLIPLLPLYAAALGVLLPKKNKHFVSSLTIIAMATSFIISLFALNQALKNTSIHSTYNFSWFNLGQESVRIGILLDPLTAFMAVMVTFISTLIFIFSTSYMKEDENMKQFFCFLSFFASAMLGIIISNSLLLLFISWELVGLASYLLIGFWFHKPEAAAAAKKAFLTTRIGDLGFLLGILWLYHTCGTLLFYDHGHGILEHHVLASIASQATIFGLPLVTAIGLLIFCGAAGKSGQFPLHVWLPDAMEGPTPVSALIHAATMVAAGVFLIARMYPLMQADQFIIATPFHTLTVIAFIGAITALLGALIAGSQYDIKRVLAYSTISQLGYMMMALGLGSWLAAIFHLLTHAFFKALLFLGAGSVIHASHHEQDMRKLGGLSKSMPITFATFSIGMLALCGFPFLFSGFWSKEAIIHAAYEWPVSILPLIISLIAVALTAFYMTRLMGEVFFGTSRADHHHHTHENKAQMTVPLSLLALCAIAIGFIGTPSWPWLQSALNGTPVEAEGLFKGGIVMLGSILLVAGGIGLGWVLYIRNLRTNAHEEDPLETMIPGTFKLLGSRLKIDEFYTATLGKLKTALAILSDGLDRYVWDLSIQGLAKLGQLSGSINYAMDEEALNQGFNVTSEKIRQSGVQYSKAQSGETHGYLRVFAITVVILTLLIITLWS